MDYNEMITWLVGKEEQARKEEQIYDALRKELITRSEAEDYRTKRKVFELNGELYCPRCMKPLAREARFCSGCGQAIEVV